MNRDREIEELANLIARDHWRSGRVLPADIAAAHGLTFSFGPYADAFDGLLEWKAHRFHIYINLDSNRSADSPRSRFSFAHELGHYFLDWHRRTLEHGVPPHGSQSEYQSQTGIEREADLFAANLLMPAERVRQEMRRQVGADEIQRLAKVFGTSISAMAIRCTHISASPIIVMKWSRSGRAWCWSSDRYTQTTGNRSYRALDRIPADSATRASIESSVTDDSAIRSRGTTLSTWFPSVRPGSHLDEILVEECIGLGQFGAITILRHP